MQKDWSYVSFRIKSLRWVDEETDLTLISTRVQSPVPSRDPDRERRPLMDTTHTGPSWIDITQRLMRATSVGEMGKYQLISP